MAETTRNFETVMIAPSGLQVIPMQTDGKDAASLPSRAPLSDEQREKLQARAIVLRLIDYFRQ